MMMIAIMMIIASYTNDDDDHHDVDRMKSIFHCTLNIFRFPEPAGEISGIALLYSASAESLSYGASQGLLFILLWFAMGIHLCTINIVTLVFSETPI